MKVAIVIDGDTRLVRTVTDTLDLGDILLQLGRDMSILPVVLLGPSVATGVPDTVVLRLTP